MSSQQFTFDPAQLPRVDNLGQRRRYIEQYIQRFHKELLPQMALAREGAIFFVSRKYEERGKLEAPFVYFEYMVDKSLWSNIFMDLGKDAPAWPWKKGPDSGDMSGGMSSSYRQWRSKYGLPTTPQQEVDTPQAASLVPPQVHPPLALPVALNTQHRIKNPVALDMAARQRFWEMSSGDECIGVLAGPFTLNLPVWLDFEKLVVGEHGCDIDTINNEILESAVAISWEVSDGKPVRLVVGFNDGPRSSLPAVQQCLFEVWCDVVAWFCSVVMGAPFRLAAYLRAIQVVNPLMDRTPDVQKAQSLWQQSLAEGDLFASRARELQEYFDFWSPMIREVIQQPLGVAEEGIAGWICSEEDLDERTKRFNVARDVWLSSSSDPKAIRRAGKWAQTFLATIQPSA
ncbi:hypothetical protein FPANT_2425 [Fusarium pseudoanthophilum]|uniref:Uncharacterized protein n=1 Tax=Fusarium pseudoanthophilum TaxID=48495 RepID=A0A8H5UWW3_9HYPO|nr:hypothetical protein FPANT_2425 [Fusarium pseudoanthophilum]